MDFNAISIGKAGNGIFNRTCWLLRSMLNLWNQESYYGYTLKNDLDDLRREMKSSILRKYLNESDYSQNLISRQEEIDDVLKNYVQIKLKEKRKKLLKLTKLRKMINLIPTPLDEDGDPITLTSTPIPRSIFRDILLKSRQMVSGWNGKMYLAYLPYF